VKSIFKIAFLFSAVFFYGQVTVITATDDRDFRQNKKFTLTIILEINGNDFVQESPLKLPDFSKFDILGTASEQNSLVDSKSGTVINQMVYQYLLQPKISGKMKIGSALVKVSGKMYKSEPFDINVKEDDRKNSDNSSMAKNEDNIYLNLEVENKEVYENQPIMAVLKVYSRDFDNFRKVKNIIFPQQDNVNIRPVSFAKSDIEPLENDPDWSSQVLAVFMIFPNEAGKIEVSPVSVSLKNSEVASKIVSNKVKLSVKSLPKDPPENYKNAVGNFAVNLLRDKPKSDAELNKPLNVAVKISGEGNLNFVHIPKLASSNDYTFYEPNISEKIRPGTEGIKGEIVEHYIVVPKKSGKIDIHTEKFSFFNPNQNKYVDLGAENLAINVMTAEQISNAKTTIERVNEYTNNVLETMNTPILKTSQFKIKEKNKFHWGIFLGNSGLILALVYILLFLRKTSRLKKRKPIINNSKSANSVSETEAEIREKLETDAETHFEYLKTLLHQKNYPEFFEAYKEFQNEVEEKTQAKNYKNLQHFVETEKGASLAEDWRLLQQKIQIEKYAPLHSEENMQKIFDEMVKVYTVILK
jgi:hypothetical protein